MQGQFIGAPNASSVLRLDLSAFGTEPIRSITLKDIGDNTVGTGGASGFDLDFVKILDRPLSQASVAATTPSVVPFDFSDQGVDFEPGTVVPFAGGDPAWNTGTLFGNTPEGNVDFGVATLDTQDISASTDRGGVSLGRGGEITFTFANPIDPAGLYLFYADGGRGATGPNDQVEVTVNQQDGGGGPAPFQGTEGDDAIALGQGSTDGPDEIRALGGNDRVEAAGGADLVYGNAGGDSLLGNAGADILFGGRGGDDVFGGQGDDAVYGNFGDDQVFGNLGADYISGGQGNDGLFGGQDNDDLFGNLGDDILAGNAGNDVLTGGDGADTFVYSAGEDRIVDFSFDQGDRIDLPDGTTPEQALTGATAIADGTSIAFGEAGTLVLSGIDRANLSADWFLA